MATNVRELRALHTEIDTARTAAQPEAALIQRFRKYARGVQSQTLTTRQHQILHGVTGNRNADNVCSMVLRAHTGRCQLDRFAVADDAVQEYVGTLWKLWAGPLLHNRTVWATLRDGNQGVALDWDPLSGHVRAIREPWWNGKAGLWVAYDDSDRPIYAVKEWQERTGAGRRLVWWPNRIEHYKQIADGWMPDMINYPAWSEAWVDRDGQPLGLPVVHFANAAAPSDSDDLDSHYGPSILDGGPLGLQDEINDTHRDITGASRLTAFQMYYATGVGVDPTTGRPPPFRVEPAAMFNIAGPGTFGVLPAGDIGQLERGLNIKIAAISRDTATPVHLITGGDWPSGAALEQADAPLVAAVTALQAAMGPGWASLLHKATLIHNTFSQAQAPLNTEAMIETLYHPATVTTPLAAAQTVQAIAPFVSEAERLRQLGMNPKKVAQVQEEMAGDRAAADALSFVNVPGQ